MSYGNEVDADIKELEFRRLDRTEAALQGEEVHLYMHDGEHYIMRHLQDCCESVRLEDIVGDLDDMQDCLILTAEEVSQEGDGSGGDKDDEDYDSYGSHTWTFYKFQTNKGAVTLRWLGESNGYYSEKVDFVKEILTEETEYDA